MAQRNKATPPRANVKVDVFARMVGADQVAQKAAGDAAALIAEEWDRARAWARQVVRG